MTSLTYIWHDCFVFENDKISVIFDYWKDPVGQNIFIDRLDPKKPLYVFVSHFHKDHYNSEIFKWEKLFKRIRFILSNDVYRHSKYLFRPSGNYKGFKPDLKNIVVLKQGETYQDENIRTEAFASTDVGNSYIVETEGRKVFHAGDLNAWIWKEESSTEEIDAAISNFRKIISDLKKNNPEIDFAMFPVDPRMGQEYYEGASIFLKELKIKYFFPMHFTLFENERDEMDYRLKAIDFSKYGKGSYGEKIGLTGPYSRFWK